MTDEQQPSTAEIQIYIDGLAERIDEPMFTSPGMTKGVVEVCGILLDRLNEIEAALPMDYWDVHLRLADAEATINTVIHLVDGLGDWITKASIKALLKEHKL